ncbi:MAG: alpha,2-mannosyltransferase [Actinomycetota bacterium]|nr:alpha,2-mannosyltransferase [Actinomycetota bacterium]
MLDNPELARLRADRWILPTGVALWVIALAVAIQGFVRPLGQPLADLHVYATAVSSFVHGTGLYRLHGSLRSGFTYPPFAGLVLLPLAAVPETTSGVAWTALTVVAAAGIALMVARALPRRVGPVAVSWPALTVIALASKPLQSNLRFGQVSIFLTLAVLADVVALDGHRWQGVLTGLAAAVKLTPLLFVPYLWLIGRRRAAALAALVFGGACLIGFAVAPHDSAAFWGNYLWHESHGLPLAEGGNQSIYAVLLRAGAQGATLGVLWVSLGAAVVALGLWRARAAWVGGQRLFSLAVVGCVSILVSPISWTHHQLWILLAAAGVFTANASVDFALGALIIALMLLGLPGIQDVGAVGRWLAVNHRAALAAVVACALPFVAVRRRLSG